MISARVYGSSEASGTFLRSSGFVGSGIKDPSLVMEVGSPVFAWPGKYVTVIPSIYMGSSYHNQREEINWRQHDGVL